MPRANSKGHGLWPLVQSGSAQAAQAGSRAAAVPGGRMPLLPDVVQGYDSLDVRLETWVTLANGRESRLIAIGILSDCRNHAEMPRDERRNTAKKMGAGVDLSANCDAQCTLSGAATSYH
jgi:hypothetical protein